MASRFLSVAALEAMFLLFVVVASAAPHGFTVDLIRRDSPREPRQQHFPNAYHRLMLRPPSRSLGSPFTDTVADSNEYLMKIQIGTPPVEIVGVADTGSDLVWTQCLPCVTCFTQNFPVFDPAKSSTYRDVTCSSSQCQSVYRVPCSVKDGACPYAAAYGTGSSYSIGTVGVDAVTLPTTSGSPFVMPETIVGCGHNNTYFSPATSGIIGLGWGPSSLISQMGDAVQGLFSYCLGAKKSKINFGANAVVSGAGVVSTTLHRNPTRPSNYFLNLEAISADGTRAETSGTSMKSADGNIIIDSGSTETIMASDYYLRVKAIVSSAAKAEPADNPDRLCFKTDNLEDLPEITMHFTGADIVLGRSNTYANVAPQLTCLIIRSVDGVPPIFGNLAQSNLLIGYDTLSEVISFKPTDCSALWS